jgi:hypothetical protein
MPERCPSTTRSRACSVTILPVSERRRPTARSRSPSSKAPAAFVRAVIPSPSSRGTFGRGVRFDHRPHLESATMGRQLRCTSCHSQIVVRRHVEVTTSTCFTCHFKGEKNDRELAPVAGCTGCHELLKGDIAVSSIRDGRAGTPMIFYAADLLKLSNGWLDEALSLPGKPPLKSDDALVRGGYCAVLCHSTAGVRQPEFVTFGKQRIPHVRASPSSAPYAPRATRPRCTRRSPRSRPPAPTATTTPRTSAASRATAPRAHSTGAR